MDSMQMLNAKLLEMGATKKHLESKLIPMMLAIFADEENAKGLFNTFWDLKKEINDREGSLYNAERYFESQKRDFEDNVKKTLGEIEEAQMEIEEARKEIFKCETAEARDKIRLAEYYRSATRTVASYSPNIFLKGIGDILGKESE